MNAPRRTADFKVYEAWEVVLRAKTLQDISNNRSFLEARQKVNAEVERCTHTAPAFSRDRRVALLTIKSGFQVHPVIATRWAGHLRVRGLQLVMVANEGYHPSGQHTNFSCRIIASLRRLPENERPNLIEILKDYSRKVPDEGFLERVGVILQKDTRKPVVGSYFRPISSYSRGQWKLELSQRFQRFRQKD
ncbi:DHH family [Pyrrhoderma noxium]|uniref:DHH family n=1 Tax=Pyrrhoderma noxium TaxID=2282107 RepID=A0A286UK82_9AGAM|nr:DHH family [Pyrrhoderma noxium]